MGLRLGHVCLWPKADMCLNAAALPAFGVVNRTRPFAGATVPLRPKTDINTIDIGPQSVRGPKLRSHTVQVEFRGQVLRGIPVLMREPADQIAVSIRLNSARSVIRKRYEKGGRYDQGWALLHGHLCGLD